MKLLWVLCFGAVVMTVSAAENLNALLDGVRKQYGLPAVAAVLMKGGKIVAEGVAGTRVVDGKGPATLDDKFHLGSDTKSFTALLAAMLVEEGKLRWDLTLEEAYPEWKDKIPESLRKATLLQLLSHSSGLSGDNEEVFKLYFDPPKDIRPLPELRMALIEKAWKLPPAGQPGEKFVYSNLGYIVAGSIIERAAGKSWEELMHERIFTPMGLSSAGLGPQCSLGVADAAVPHLREDDGKVYVMLGGPFADVPAVMGPAGNAHMTPRDFARWVSWNAAEGRRPPNLVSAETLKKLHTPVIATPPGMKEEPGTPQLGQYALGWGQVTYPWSDKTFLYHGGSNGMNLAWMVALPEQDLALVLMTNIGGKQADLAFRELTKEIMGGAVGK
ncbi:hypothetical protein BH09VER1_BH09VER1_37460 [soil metagenome]